MPSLNTLITLCILFLTVSAQSGYNFIAGPYKPGPANDPSALQAISAAGRSPNLTDSVTFTRTFNGNSENWTWRINITSLAVPNTRIDDLGEDNTSANYSQGLCIANTQWELQWPGDSPTLGSFLQQRGMNLSVQTLLTVLPPNVTQSYNPTDNGDCTSVLGDSCSQEISQSASADHPVDFARLRACDGTLNAMSSSGDAGGFSDGSNLGPITTASNASDTPSAYPRDSTLFYRTSSAYTMDNETAFNDSARALQLLILSPAYGMGPIQGSSGPSVLCRIVDKETTTTSPREGSGALSRPGLPAAALWGLLLTLAFLLVV
ncbi:uncharacterized protein MYCGRDRAFT_94299 [Zymoseptoria tritici IPO323]|uniref:Uncharacterized protein n=1 Tax=Zymoseptoria tritici (strain CBS 115943 / IPO323) TaxID=336722 RepID=F9XES4_ZYMTI|nr:uncharacterized protein MYCGRDRAFT_94299 [Zymoseptoria tritici IPO323]EGP85588.1 hypothetical protein MYCGRDRAFT_94299 [Zymoseptoria tritici IPO323]